MNEISLLLKMSGVSMVVAAVIGLFATPGVKDMIKHDPRLVARYRWWKYGGTAGSLL